MPEHTWRRRRIALFSAALSSSLWATVGCSDATAPQPPPEELSVGRAAENNGPDSGRTIRAEVVAIDQVYVYNRFGSFNPAGMMYALKRDVVSSDANPTPGPGRAMLRPNKRPRPMVLRANVGDTIEIKFTNWLAPSRDQIREPDGGPFHVDGGDVGGGDVGGGDAPSDSPATRSASIHVNGLQGLDIKSQGGNVGNGPNALAEPGETRIYRLRADHEGSFLLHSAGAMSGGEGDGGQIVQGLFGSVTVEPANSVWVRSQVTSQELTAATAGLNPDGTHRIDYHAVDNNGDPILEILKAAGNNTWEIVHSDLNAIISGYTETAVGTASSVDQDVFREFTVLFHDELNAVQAFPRLQDDKAFQGVRDGFGINYGAAGLGAELLANRQRVGPTANCTECKFEEFFLSSWAGGDPALNVVTEDNGKVEGALYPDDPSNVHHSYLGDPVRFRNLHAGPKETHVFHLHAHQWLLTPNGDNSTYLDSQTIGPGGSYTYNINYGGGGNRNFTVGDAIFHCHLYPHFAQGMWELWRNHDVFEAGTADRNLPDGEIKGGTPVPALVPLPGRAMPPEPTLEMPGYPHYIAAKAGHRPPQPPLDMEFDGGLPRHIITSVPPGGVTFGQVGQPDEFRVDIHEANIKLLPQGGTAAEKRAMDFHAGNFANAAPFTTIYGFPARAYPTFTPEGQPAQFVVNGRPPAPGAPYADPCPASAPKRPYRAVYLQIDGTVNKAGWHDPQMRIEVLERDYEATVNRSRPLEPLFFRANSGDCVTFSATNLIPGALQADDFQVYTPTDTMGQHIHLVKFDVTSSDGAANGWNYEDGTFAADEVVALVNAANNAGGAFRDNGKLDESGVRKMLTVTPHPRLGVPGAQTTVQRWWADPLVNRQGEDRTIRTVFTHDHFSPSSHQHHGFYAALLTEPAGSTWRDPTTGQALGARSDGGPTSFRADILPPGPKPPYREFGMAFADFAILYDNQNRPVNPPTSAEAALPIAVEHIPPPPVFREVISANDPGTFLINYRNEPIPLRIAARSPDGTFSLKPGPKGKMENVFRSGVHGDPFTPILPVYDRDAIQVRLIQGAQEEQHVFSMHGFKWRTEPSDEDSGFNNGQAIGISEHMEFIAANGVVATKNADGSADYLYESAPADDLWNGMWGILRSYGEEIDGLLPLPGNTPPAVPRTPTVVCPANAPERSYTVHAILAKDTADKRLTYSNRFDLWDPDGIMFVEQSRLQDTLSGALRAEPLILRAAAGECIKVTLKNDLSARPTNTPQWNYLPPITEEFNVNQVIPSDHVSLHPQLVVYDVNRSDGASIGRNKRQTVAPGETRLYTWYAGDFRPGKGANERVPIEYGAINLKDMADVVTHGMHGAIGSLIVEPLGATWTTDPGTAAQATVQYATADEPNGRFRELVLLYQDEVALHSNNPTFQCSPADNLNCGTALRNIGGTDDAEETGHKAFNYRTEPLWARLGLPPQASPNEVNDRILTDILSSAAHGDPETPIFTAHVGDKVRVRVLQPSSHARQHAFTLWGSEWPHNPWAAGARSARIGPNPVNFTIGTQGGFAAMRALNVVPFYSAGGLFGVPGDYLYRDQPSFLFLDGLWGIFRVTP